MFRLEPSRKILIIMRTARCRALRQRRRTKPHLRSEAENNEEASHPSVTRSRVVSVNVLALRKRIVIVGRASAQSATIKRLDARRHCKIVGHVHQEEKDQTSQFEA